MSDFPEKAEDKVNALAVAAIGIAVTLVLWASVIALQAFYENTNEEISKERRVKGKTAAVRGLKSEQRSDLSRTRYADAAKGTLKRLNIEHAKNAVIKAAASGQDWIPTLGKLDVATIPAVNGRPADGVSLEPTEAPPATETAPAEGAEGATAIEGVQDAVEDASTDPAATLKEAAGAQKSTPTAEVPADVKAEINKAQAPAKPEVKAGIKAKAGQ